MRYAYGLDETTNQNGERDKKSFLKWQKGNLFHKEKNPKCDN